MPCSEHRNLDAYAQLLGTLAVRGARILLVATTVIACSGPASPAADAGDIARPDGSPGDVAPLDGSSDATVPIAPVALWRLPRTGPNAFALPWPSDLARTSDGLVDLRYLVSPSRHPLAGIYTDQMRGRLRGFSPLAATYFRFSVAVNTATVPAPEASTMPAASVQIVDIDPASPERGHRVPIQFAYWEAAGDFVPANTLAVAPVFSHPLRPNVTYAVVITDGLLSRGGSPFDRDADLIALLAADGGDAAVVAARSAMASPLAAIESAGIARDRIRSLSVFTTVDPTVEMSRGAAFLRRTNAVPAARTIDVSTPTIAGFETYAGTFGPVLQFQTGTPPYAEPPSGDILFDPSGDPIVQRRLDVRFVLLVPTTSQPASGWPMVVYGPGTGGDATTATDSMSQAIASRGIAVLTFDQQFNGDREPPSTGLYGGLLDGSSAFFNFINPLAGRMNNVQAGLELIQVSRFARDLQVPASVAVQHAAIHFDPARLHYFGHSQGSVTGPLALATDDTIHAAMLSGGGGALANTIVQRTVPVNILTELARTLGVSDPSEINALHPVPMLAQAAGDTADPIEYARRMTLESGTMAPHDLYITEGLIDHYSPPDGCVALSIAAGAAWVGPIVRAEPGFELAGLPQLALPVQANLGPGRATAGMRQFRATREGHFVVYDIPEATQSVATFFETASMGATTHARIE